MTCQALFDKSEQKCDDETMMIPPISKSWMLSTFFNGVAQRACDDLCISKSTFSERWKEQLHLKACGTVAQYRPDIYEAWKQKCLEEQK